MAYPDASNFRSAEPWAAWWGYRREDGGVDYCAARGGTVVELARVALGLPAAGGWDAALQRAHTRLRPALRGSGAPRSCPRDRPGCR